MCDGGGLRAWVGRVQGMEGGGRIWDCTRGASTRAGQWCRCAEALRSEGEVPCSMFVFVAAWARGLSIWCSFR
eukprot:1308674-Alexandrium_andersonii.AAC.1